MSAGRTDGAAPGDGREATRADGQPSETERAERLMEEWGERLGAWASAALGRAREEAEDIWAEAQSLSRGEYNPK